MVSNIAVCRIPLDLVIAHSFFVEDFQSDALYWLYHTYSYFDYITIHFLNKFSLDNDVILVHRKLGHKLIILEDFINLHNNFVLS